MAKSVSRGSHRARNLRVVHLVCVHLPSVVDACLTRRSNNGYNTYVRESDRRTFLKNVPLGCCCNSVDDEKAEDVTLQKFFYLLKGGLIAAVILLTVDINNDRVDVLVSS